MKYQATAMCFVGGARRRPGEVFDAPAGLTGSAFVQVGGDEPVTVKAGRKVKGETLSSMTKDHASALSPMGVEDTV